MSGDTIPVTVAASFRAGMQTDTRRGPGSIATSDVLAIGEDTRLDRHTPPWYLAMYPYGVDVPMRRNHMSTTTTIAVDGMTCGHCVSSVQSEVGKIDGVTDVSVDLSSGQVTIVADTAPDPIALQGAVEEAGFEVRT
jgi:copper chaperone CopZ